MPFAAITFINCRVFSPNCPHICSCCCFDSIGFHKNSSHTLSLRPQTRAPTFGQKVHEYPAVPHGALCPVKPRWRQGIRSGEVYIGCANYYHQLDIETRCLHVCMFASTYIYTYTYTYRCTALIHTQWQHYGYCVHVQWVGSRANIT